ncbi:LacI family transcriptional regulator [Fontibacillus phaseoli]|uniref:LacI family transcriptional regulator n=1 Tax=Fontibacillus phaseoli TaxID=1416533 RepID=A0A369BPZ8_9BACL|nr:LacI family DNA-binding transcriptional regulator [Fontibacillus phaseoli]RCX22686.1 LacI family transcriptional regulator [Fontibacillus phaseoli]
MKKVTIQEIADFSGVSKYAVSRALAGKSGVSAQTREMILKAAGQLGYFKDAGKPPALLSPPDNMDGETRPGAILVLFPNVRYQDMDSLYWGPVFNGISARLNQRGADILTLTEPSGESVFSLLNPNAIGGIVTIGAVSTQVLLDIQKLDIPVVMVDHQDPAFQADAVFTDNFQCMREMMVKLVSKGYKSFQFVGHIGYAQSFYERWLGFRSALEDHKLKQEQIPELIGPEIAYIHEAVPKVVAAHELPEVFVCTNDTTAQFVMEALLKLGIHVPGQVKITGFDNTDESLPLLATIDVNKALLGMRAVDKLFWRMANPNSNFERLLIRGEVILGDGSVVTNKEQEV